MKTKIIIIIFISISISFSALAKSKIEISNVNLVEIQKMIRNIPIGFEKNYGLKDRNQIDSLLIGQVITLYCISDSSIISSEIAFRKLNNILIPILLNGDIVFFVKGTAKNNHIINLLGFGANLYAREVNKNLKKYDRSENAALLQDYTTGQSFLFYEDEVQKEKEFDLRPINLYPGCYSCETINDSLVSSTILIEHHIQMIKRNENEKREITTR